MRRLRLPGLLLTMLLLLTMTLTPALAATDIVDVPDTGTYYADEAQCLTTATKDYINAENIALTNACGGQVAVVTLEFLNDLNCEEYAYEVINQWGVGDSEKNNGTVFVLVTAEKKCWITSGSGIEDALSAGKLETILETYCYDDLDNGNYDTAVYQTVAAIFQWYESYYQISLTDYSSTEVTGDYATQTATPSLWQRITSAVGEWIRRGVLTMAALILILLVLFLMPRRRPYSSFWCGGPGPRGPRGPRNHGPRGGGFGGGFGGGPRGGGGFGGGPRGGGCGGGGGFGGGGGHGGGAGRR